MFGLDNINPYILLKIFSLVLDSIAITGFSVASVNAKLVDTASLPHTVTWCECLDRFGNKSVCQHFGKIFELQQGRFKTFWGLSEKKMRP